MLTETLPHWLDAYAVDAALSRVAPPDDAELTDILDKSLSLTSLNLKEAAALSLVREPHAVARMLAAADEVKQRVYGDRIVLTAPLHLSNHCGSECLYCANRRGNTLIERKYMTSPEIREAGKKLISQGHKRVIVVSGQLPNADVEYLAEAVSILCTVFDGRGEIRRVNVAVGPLEADQYPVLRDADVGTVLLYQDSYHESSYRTAHPSGPKSNFAARLAAPDVALEANVESIGMGLLLGLGPWRFDVLSLIQHTEHLVRVFDAGSQTVSLHRMRPAPGARMKPPYPLSDAEYLHCVAITRLAIPLTGIVLTTKEPAGLWRDACSTGCSQLVTGSMANPYESWNDAAGDGGVPFPLGETYHLDETVRFLLEEARHVPSFCTACSRLGRIGKDFFGMMTQGSGMRSQCGPNSIASFMEFLRNYATPQTRDLGEKLISEKVAALSEQERGAATRLLQKVCSGRMDEFI